MCSRLGDHRDEAEKRYTLSSRAALSLSSEKLWDEVAKCAVLCANCHRMMHCGDRCTAPPQTCVVCDRVITPGATRCKSCEARRKRHEGILRSGAPPKIDWPDDTVIVKLVRRSSFIAAGRELGVSDNAVRKRLRKRGLLGEDGKPLDPPGC